MGYIELYNKIIQSKWDTYIYLIIANIYIYNKIQSNQHFIGFEWIEKIIKIIKKRQFY